MNKVLQSPFFSFLRDEKKFLLLWLVLGFLQSAFTELWEDEAYYVFYAQQLEWSYYDHPPLVALLIKVGMSIFGGEFGVRFLFVLMGTALIAVCWRITDKKSPFLFFALVFSCLIWHFESFLALPDLPLLFFATLYYLYLKSYLNAESTGNIIGLIVSITGMAYSKYHVALIILFTLLALPKLLTKKSFWLITIGVIVLYFPHVWWQYQNDFVSLKFHLFERSRFSYHWSYTALFIVGQLIVTGPFFGIFSLYLGVCKKVDDFFTKVLKFNFVGGFLFFFLSSFKGEVLAHWTLISFIPMFLLVYKVLQEKENWQFYLKGALLLSIPLVIGARIFFMYDYLPYFLSDRKYGIQKHLHEWEKVSKELEFKASGAPVVFVNSYIKAAMYSFYTGKKSHSFHTIKYRKYQYDLWNVEYDIEGKDVLIVSPDSLPNSELYFAPESKRKYFLRKEKRYQTLNRLEAKTSILEQSDEKGIFQLEWKEYEGLDLLDGKKVNLWVYFYNDNELVKKERLFSSSVLNNCLNQRQIAVDLPRQVGKYFVRFGLSVDDLPPGVNSNILELYID